MEPTIKKLTSRKFLLTIFVVILTVANKVAELGIDDAAIASIAGTIAAWILGESALDRQRIDASQKVAFEALQREANGAVEYLQRELQVARDTLEKLSGEILDDDADV